MLSALLGKKVGMTQVYDEAGVLHPVTVVQAGPCTVLQVKSPDNDGYSAVQMGFDDVKPHRASKPEIGHASKAGAVAKKFVREFRLEDGGEAEVGSTVTVEVFDGVQYVDVIGTSKGKGYAGPMKRHGFGGFCASHGTERKHRAPGSIGGHGTNLGMGPKIKKGKKMGGHMGDDRVSSRNHILVGIDRENNLLLIKGPVPGAKGGYLMIRKSKTAKVKA